MQAFHLKLSVRRELIFNTLTVKPQIPHTPNRPRNAMNKGTHTVRPGWWGRPQMVHIQHMSGWPTTC